MATLRSTPAASQRYLNLNCMLPADAAGLVALVEPLQRCPGVSAALARDGRAGGRTLVGIYQAQEAGIEDDPETPWATVCELHTNLVLHTTRKLAESHASDPCGWCLTCRGEG